jgi:type VI secretion system secreted protein VgrG
VLAKLNITQTANKITITRQGRGGDQRRLQLQPLDHPAASSMAPAGTWREHAAVHSLVGPASEGKPSLPRPGAAAARGSSTCTTSTSSPRGEKRQGVAQGDYTVVDSEGGVARRARSTATASRAWRACPSARPR